MRPARPVSLDFAGDVPILKRGVRSVLQCSVSPRSPLPRRPTPPVLSGLSSRPRPAEPQSRNTYSSSKMHGCHVKRYSLLVRVIRVLIETRAHREHGRTVTKDLAHVPNGLVGHPHRPLPPPEGPRTRTPHGLRESRHVEYLDYGIGRRELVEQVRPADRTTDRAGSSRWSTQLPARSSRASPIPVPSPSTRSSDRLGRAV